MHTEHAVYPVLHPDKVILVVFFTPSLALQRGPQQHRTKEAYLRLLLQLQSAQLPGPVRQEVQLAIAAPTHLQQQQLQQQHCCTDQPWLAGCRLAGHLDHN